nr:NAD(P)-dependent oxidoreductase [uncultured Prevotella sp.]
MKIGIIKETKIPVDNRVALTPCQVALLNKQYPEHQIVVQSSDVRAYTDEEYLQNGVEIVDNVNDCDILFGIKEARIDTLIPNKHYIFFGHIAKMQPYNRPLLQSMIKKHLTFTDYEYLVDDNNTRVCAFGWWAGVVGVYYTLRGYGLKTKSYHLPKPDIDFTLDELLKNLCAVSLPAVKILITGNGRVSRGAQYVMERINAQQLNEKEFLSPNQVDSLSFAVANAESLVKRTDGGIFNANEFKTTPQNYYSDFMRWAQVTDILICAHYWAANAPVYLTADDLVNTELEIKMIGDITCDIKGSIHSTIRSTTHSEPYYDYNPVTKAEEIAFSDNNNISVMAVDTCPNALPRDTSKYFGEMLIEHVFIPLLQGVNSSVINRATILKEGELTERFSYLNDFAFGEKNI